MSAIAIIPARGGSKGLPRKNILPLAGKPLIGWTIEAALASSKICRTIVSTDCPEIAEVSRAHGAEIVMRPGEISGDIATSESAVLHALNEVAGSSILPEITVFLQCTSPLTEADDINSTIAMLEETSSDSALAVADFHYFLWKSNGQDFVGINHDKSKRLLRQQREQQFIETGAVYAFRTEGFLKHKHRFFGKTAFHISPPDRVLEIDDAVDFEIAQVRMQARRKADAITKLPTTIDLIVFDFDGVLTDDHVYVNELGVESVLCSRSDGMGFSLAKQAGMQMVILSREENPVVAKRADKLGVEVIHGVENKLQVLGQYLKSRKLAWKNTIYVGNDLNDFECIQHAGCGVAVSDAHPKVKQIANLCLSRAGGQHAARELLELVLSKHSNYGGQ